MKWSLARFRRATDSSLWSGIGDIDGGLLIGVEAGESGGYVPLRRSLRGATGVEVTVKHRNYRRF